MELEAAEALLEGEGVREAARSQTRERRLKLTERRLKTTEPQCLERAFQTQRNGC